MVKSVLLLVAIALVLIGVATLIIGIFSDTLVWVFVSIGSTVLAGVVLYVLYRLGKRQDAPMPDRAYVAMVDQQAAAPAAAPVPSGIPPVPPAPPLQPTGAPSAFAPAGQPAGGGVAVAEEDEEFPIAEYDDLRVAEILPLLPELDADELQVVRMRESTGKARATVLARIDELADADGSPTEAAFDGFGDDEFPIADYDDLKVAEILPLLTQLDPDELEVVAEREERGANRQTILNRIDARLDALEGRAGDAAPAAAAGAPAKAAPAAAATNAVKAVKSAKKATATKKAPAVKKAPAAPPVAKAAGARAKAAATPTTAAAKTTKAPAKTTAKTKAAAKKAPAAAKARRSTKA